MNVNIRIQLVNNVWHTETSPSSLSSYEIALLLNNTIIIIKNNLYGAAVAHIMLIIFFTVHINERQLFAVSRDVMLSKCNGETK